MYMYTQKDEIAELKKIVDKKSLELLSMSSLLREKDSRIRDLQDELKKKDDEVRRKDSELRQHIEEVHIHVLVLDFCALLA